MFVRFRLLILPAALLGLASLGLTQDAPSPPPPPVPQGIEVQARGPIHEAFAGPTTEAAPTTAVDKKPPAAIDELPPAEKPSGNVVWISGYWAYDEDQKDYLWVSGVWRTSPANKQWVAGYWREQGTQWQWVPGFWTKVAKEEEQKVTYLPPPPAAPAIAPPGAPQTPGSFFVPGGWVWTGSAYAWRAGYWTQVQPNYVWVPNHYRWTPSGYIFVDGYWDYALKDRGLLYAPVVIRPEVVTVGFTYTPAYAVRDTVVVDAFFVRPATCHYYFGDYYGPAYETRGYQSCIVYSRRNYDSIVVYETYERRSQPNWINIQVNLYNDRCSGRAYCPPRTLVAQQQFIQNNSNNTTFNNTTINNTTVNKTTVVNNITMIAPPAQVASAKKASLVPVDNATRQQARLQAAAVQQVGQQRVASEKPLAPGAPRQARVASLNVPKAQPVRPGMVAPKPAPVRPATPVAGAAAHPGASGSAMTSGSNTPGLRPATGAPYQPGVKTPIQPVSTHSTTTTATPGVHPGSTTAQPVAQPVSRVQPTTTGLPPATVQPGMPGLAGTALRPGQPGYRPPPKVQPVRRPPPKRLVPDRDHP